MPNTDLKPTSEKEQTQAPQIPPHTPPYTQQIEDDKIDLYELWNTLWDKKWLVIAVTTISTLGFVVYALQQPIVYKAEALLLPPKANDIQSLNVQGVQASSKVIFSDFKKNFSSRILQRKFIEKHGLMDILAPNRTPETRDIEIFEGFSGRIKVGNYGKEGIRVSTQSGDPDFAAKLVNDYINFLDIETIRGLSADARNSIAAQIQEIESAIDSKKQMERVRRKDQIKETEDSISSKLATAKKRREDEIRKIEYTIGSKRAKAKKRREDKIKLFEEAAVIAAKLGVKDRVDSTNKVQNNQLNISTTEVPLYYRGFRALNAEIELLNNRESDDPYILGLRELQQKLVHLRSRKSDDPFIFGLRDLQVKVDLLRSIKSDYTFFPGLRSLQEELSLLRSIKIEEEGLHSVTIDQSAYPPKNRIKPDRRKIVSIGIVISLFSAIFIAFFVSFIQKQKKIYSA